MSAPWSTSVSATSLGGTAVILVTASQGVQYQIFNAGNVPVYLGPNNSVTSTNGMILPPNSFINWYNAFNYGTPGVPPAIWAICATPAAGTIGTVINVTGDAS
jgi:hypothetical protein